MKKLILLIILATVSSVYGQTDDKETLKRANQNLVSLYQSKRFDDALKYAQQALDLDIKIYGSEHRETALAYNNLGVIYRAKRKFKEAVENLQKSLDTYQKIPGYKGREIITAYETLASAQFLDGKAKEAEANYLKAIETAENIFGKESKESISPALYLANLYARDKKFDQSDEIYLRAYALTVKLFGKEAKEIEQIDDARTCSNVSLKPDFGSEKEKAFSAAKAKIFGVDSINPTNVINGKAVSLPKPEYPFEARKLGLIGSVPVKVMINEQGDVIRADSICRSDVLGAVSEQAARRAKFSVTFLDGKPVQVTGIIIYNFIF